MIGNLVNSDWFRPLVKWLIFFYCLFMFVYLMVFVSNPKVIAGSDLVSFLTGAKIITEGKGSQVYNLDLQFATQLEVINPVTKTNLLPFRSLPFVGTLYLPFVNLSLNVSFYIILLSNIILLYLSLKLLFGLMRFKLNPMLIWSLFVFYYPVVAGLTLGQNSFVIFLTAIASFKLILDKKFFRAGLLSGLFWIKPQFLLLAPFLYVIAGKKTKYILGLLLTTAAIMLISVKIAGSDTLINYPSFLAITENIKYGSRPYHMFTIYALMKVFINPELITNNILMLTSLLFYLILAGYVYKNKSGYGLWKMFSIGIFTTVLFSGHTLVHDLLLLLVPILIILGRKEIDAAGYTQAIFLYAIPLVFYLGSVYAGTLGLLALLIYNLSLQNNQEIPV